MPCVICINREAKSYLMCEVCGRSYDKLVDRTSTIDEIVRWTANRARLFERKRASKRSAA